MPDQRKLRRWTRKAFSRPPHETTRLATKKIREGMAAIAVRRRDGLRGTYLVEGPHGPIARLLEAPPRAVLEDRRSRWDALIARYRTHTFDLLGSGWVRVHHGMQAAGLENHLYPPPDCPGRVNRSNRKTAEEIRSLISPTNESIDWQLDFKSGFRWCESTWYRDIDYGHDAGADVKSPWELGRCQHLPLLALRACLAGLDDDEELVAALSGEFRDQVLDFIAANPPRYGVQWVTAMDVAIRVSNWLLAHDLFRAAGHVFDAEFEGVFTRSIQEHGQHIAANLEWSEELRGNHYLADIVGLLFVAAYLPRSTTTDAWLIFSTRELLREIRLQFHADGGSFEGSTCYHRLSAEMAVYAVAILLALPPERIRALANPEDGVIGATRDLPGEPVAALALFTSADGRESPVSPDIIERLGRARAFTQDLTKPNGRVPQLGDNDSGRFVRLEPVVEPIRADEAVRRFSNLDHVALSDSDGPYLVEDHLDHHHLVDAIGGLLGVEPDHGEGYGVDGWIVRHLARPQPEWGELEHSRAAQVEIGDLHDLSEFEARISALPDQQRRELRIDVRHDVGTPERVAYPDFGVYRWRSDRLFLTVRCGPRGQNGFGGHDHNDQLSIELAVDGEDWIRDPGTYVYTPLPLERNQYRSQRSHFGPRLVGPEPASLTEGPFTLGPGGEGRCMYWGDRGFAGISRAQDGRTALCLVRPTGREIVVIHGAEGAPLLPVAGDESDWRSHIPTIPHSPGYGILERA